MTLTMDIHIFRLLLITGLKALIKGADRFLPILLPSCLTECNSMIAAKGEITNFRVQSSDPTNEYYLKEISSQI
ncbi:hypothetical protein QQG55_52690 [Brugia pahangi]